MKILALALLITVASASFLEEEMPTLDLRGQENEIGDIPHTLSVDGAGSFFKIILNTNPSTGFRWHSISHPASNCVCKVKLIDQKMIDSNEEPRRVGAQKTIELIYWAEFNGLQDIVLVYNRSKPNAHQYDEFATNSRTSRMIRVNIGEHQELSPCKA